MTDVTLSRGFLLDSAERMAELLIFISRTHTLIQPEALPVTFISVITMAGRLNGENTHYNGDTHTHMANSCMDKSQP